MPVISGRDLVNFLCRQGYYVKHVHGSHHFCVRQDGTGTPLDIPVHANEDVAKGTLRFIIKVYARNEGIDEDNAMDNIGKI